MTDRPTTAARRGAALTFIAAFGLAASAFGQQGDPSRPPPGAPPGAASPRADVRHVEGKMANGNMWVAETPNKWNGVLLLESHGFSPTVRPPSLGDRRTKDWFLDHGYAMLASSFSKGGWSLEEGVPDQLAALDEFVKQFGKPKRTIATGGSMGALVTIALVERHPERIDAGIASCGSISGALGMLNMALDGAFAFKTLLAPDAGLQLVNVTDDNANTAKVRAVLQSAQATPQGRARIALSGVLAQLPLWSDARQPEPAADDYDAQQAQAASAFAMGVFFPRVDQEQRAGGAFSWNTGVDYRKQLALSGRRAYVEALYKKAGLDLEADLDTLAKAPRITGDPAAIAYMRANYVPTGKLSRPVFSYHTIGDGMTMVTKQGAYADAVAAAGRSRQFGGGWVRRAGHCTFTPAETIAAVKTVEARLDTGKWDVAPETLNARAKASGLGESAFVAYKPAPFLRPCTGLQRACAGEPARKRRG